MTLDVNFFKSGNKVRANFVSSKLERYVKEGSGTDFSRTGKNGSGSAPLLFRSGATFRRMLTVVLRLSKELDPEMFLTKI